MKVNVCNTTQHFWWNVKTLTCIPTNAVSAARRQLLDEGKDEGDSTEGKHTVHTTNKDASTEGKRANTS